MYLPKNTTENYKDIISSWIFSPSLIRLVENFGGKYPNKDLRECVKYLAEFSEIWDFRAKKNAKTENNEQARWLVESEDFSSETLHLIEKASAELGLRNNSIPSGDSFDYVWILGGAKLSCLLRLKLTLEIIRSKSLKPKKIAMLASMRRINDSEREATDTYAKSAETEFDLFACAFNKFCECEKCSENKFECENENLSWVFRRYSNDFCILSAPSRDPEIRRANSLDTYIFAMEKLNIEKGSKILLVTSEIYVPYQHMEAFREIALGYDVEIETVGFPASWGGELQGMNAPENYLQEIRSTILSIIKIL